ncbi:MAG: hypothetical protein CMH93_04250 [Oceanicaulis sp.]|nr:hypothetical protein [Oceanicaulis sp.]
MNRTPSIWAILAASVCVACAPATAEDAVPPAVAASLEAAVEQGGRPGVVLGYVRDGESVFLAYGRTGNPASSAIGPDTVFELGSVTKLFTAETLAGLAVQGEVSPDTPLAAIWPDRLAANPVTLAQLATHRAGLPRQVPGEVLSANDANALIEFARSAAPSEAPAYSNTGVALLALALSEATGRSVAGNLAIAVTGPFGLTDTGYEPGQPERLAHPHAGGRDISDSRPQTVSVAHGTGGLYSTARDLARLVEAHLAPEGDTAAIVNLALAGTDGVPLGWQVHDNGRRQVFHHSGDANGYQVFVGFRQDTATGVVLLSNASADDGLQQIALHLLDPSVPLPVFGSGDAAEGLAQYEGEYRFSSEPDGNRIRIEVSGADLIYVETAPDGTLVRRTGLVEREPGLFQIRGIPAGIRFGDAGAAELLVGEDSYELVRVD